MVINLWVKKCNPTSALAGVGTFACGGASSRSLRSQFRVSGFVSDGRVNGAWVIEWKVVEIGQQTPKKHPFIANFWSIPTLAFKIFSTVVMAAFSPLRLPRVVCLKRPRPRRQETISEFLRLPWKSLIHTRISGKGS